MDFRFPKPWNATSKSITTNNACAYEGSSDHEKRADQQGTQLHNINY